MNKMKDARAKQAKYNPREITVYTAEWCGACKKRVPQILKKAQAAGLQVKLIDWDNDLSTKDKERLIKRVEFVPYIDYMGHEIEEDDLNLLINTNTGISRLSK